MADRIFDRPGPEFGLWFQDWADRFLTQLEQVPEIQQALGEVAEATQAAQDAADLAIAAAASADEAAEAVTASSSLSLSAVDDPSPITVTDAGSNVTISIASHNRVYGDGTTVPVNAGSITGQPYNTGQYVYYLDPARAGGSVTYLSSTDPNDAAQLGDTHSVGFAPPIAALDPPAAGGGTRPPGLNYYEP